MSICQIYNLCAETLWLGRYGENGARDIAIDVGRWFADLGAEGTVVLVNWRPGEDDQPYNPNITMDGSRVVWSPSSIDLAISGRGFAELRYYVGNALAKSKTFRTVIDRTPSEGANPPSAADDWLERMEDAAVTAQTASETAVTAAETATEGAQAVAQALPTITQAAATATSAAATATSAATEAALSEEVASTAANAAQAASETATAASQTAVSASGTATTKAAQAVEAAGTATTKASEATQAATTATANAQTSTAKAGEATTAAATATSKATEATTAASTASAAAITATSAASTATSEASTATAAKTAAQTAQTGAETAQAAAEQAAEEISESATQIATNTSDISELKADFLQLPTDGVTANAKQLLSSNGTDNTEPYMLRAVPVNADRAELDAVVGVSVPWNQLVQNGNFADTSVWGNTSPTSVSIANNEAVVQFPSSSIGTLYQLNVPFITDHKYLFGASVKGESAYNTVGATIGSSFFIMTYDLTTSYKRFEKVFNYAVTSTALNVVRCNTSASEKVYVKDAVLFDLTQLFGSTIADYIYSLEQANAGAGAAWFRKLFPKDYYPYDAGTLKSVGGVSAHETVGFNQWDEEWEVGAINSNDGTDYPSTSNIRSKNYIPVVCGATYYIKSPNGVYFFGYDSNKNYVGRVPNSNAQLNTTFNVPTGIAYIRFFAHANYGTTYNHDICINISDPAKNGTYEPYVKHSYALDPTVVLRGIPKLSDGKLYYDGDRYLPDGRVQHRFNMVVLDGSENWAADTDRTGVNSGTVYHRFYLTKNDMYKSYNAHGYIGYILSTIPTTRDGYVNDDPYTIPMSVTGYTEPSGNYLYIVVNSTLSNIADVAQLKAWLSSNHLPVLYELATPTTENATPYQSLQVCGPNGTEEFVSTGIVPVGHETFYPENLRAKIEGLPWDFSTLIAPTETGTASRNYTVGSLLIMGNVLYKVTANIANGGTITPGTNCTATTLSEVISALQ